jgi:arylsulfatase
VSLYIDDTVVATLADVRTHPATFGLAGASVQVGRNSGQAVCGRYSTPFAFTGGTIAKVVVDVSGTPYVDRERELALAFARD